MTTTPAVRWLAAFGLAYSLLHHQGFVLGRLGTVGDTGTRWADWLDLLTPALVLGPAAGALAAARAARRTWLIFAAGALLYVEGHGIHLAANSISNTLADSGLAEAEPGAAATDAVTRVESVAHLWDEQMGHYLWYAGVSFVMVALALGFGERPVPGGRAFAALISVAVGVTYATNALEGHVAWPSLVFASGMVAWGLVKRNRRPESGSAGSVRSPSSGVDDLLLLVFVPAVLLLGFYGVWHRGFPDPSSVGWNPLA